MNYKEIYDEVNTILWGDEIAKTKEEDVNGIGFGYLLTLYDPFHNQKGTIDPILHKRALRIFKKFADKIYLDTKDEYAVKMLLQVCAFCSELCINANMEDIYGTKEDPEFMYDGFDFNNVIEPTPEPKYHLVEFYQNDSENKITKYKFFEEAKNDFDDIVKRFYEEMDLMYGDSELKDKAINDSVLINDENHFKTVNMEIFIEKENS